MAAGLYILATPIGNARDITLRALEVLKGCDVIAAEDTRVTSKLLAIHGISKPLIPYNDHNGPQMRPKILARLEQGEAVALVSRCRHAAGVRPRLQAGARGDCGGRADVVALPGPSAVLAGLALSGLALRPVSVRGLSAVQGGRAQNARWKN